MDWDGGDGERVGGRGGQGWAGKAKKQREKQQREKRWSWGLGLREHLGAGGGDVEEEVKSSRTPDTGKLVRAPPCPG